MSNVLEPINGALPERPAANRFTPDAQERMARIRAMAAAFPDDVDPRPLTPAEIRIARQTSVEALEKAAVFADASPAVGGALADATELRDAIAFELAYGGVRDEANVMAVRVDHAIMRRKLKAVKVVRGLYRVGKGFVTLDAGALLKPHVKEMGQTLTPRQRRRKVTPPTEAGDSTATAGKK